MPIDNRSFNRYSDDAVHEAAGSGRPPQAFIVVSPDDKTSSAFVRRLIAAAGCTGQNKPCGKCEHCRLISAGHATDVIEVFPEEDRLSITVERAREIRENAYLVPDELDFKVYVFHFADKMGVASQNALLKIIEEPPSFASFGFLCTNLSSVLPTVKSRCRIINLIHATTYIETGDASSKAGKLAEETVRLLFAKKRTELFSLDLSYLSERENYRKYLICISAVLRDIATVKSGSAQLLWFADESECRNIADGASERAVFAVYDHLIGVINENDANVNVTLSQMILLSGMWNCAYPENTND